MINKVSKKVRPRVKDFLEVASNSFEFLEEYGYKLKEKRIATEYVVKDIIQVLYYNKVINRLIVIHYEPKDIDGKDINLIALSFYNDEDHLYSNNEIVFSKYLEKYSTKKNVDIEKLKYPNKNNKETFKENLEMSMLGYTYFLKDIGIKLISGEEWEDGLRFDWSSVESILYQAQKDIIYGDDNEDDT